MDETGNMYIKTSIDSDCVSVPSSQKFKVRSMDTVNVVTF